MRVIIQREFNNAGYRRVCDEYDIHIGTVFKHVHPPVEGIPGETEWTFTEGLTMLFSAPTLRELRSLIEARATRGIAPAAEGQPAGHETIRAMRDDP